jgi:hypothetical protein
MEKQCRCGGRMELELRTLKFGRETDILHVPVFRCVDCEFHEILSHVKPIFMNLLDRVEHETGPQTVYFNEISEYTDVLVKLSKSKRDERELNRCLDERVDQLLDLMNMAHQAQDEKWMGEIKYRLQQVTISSPSTYSA